MLPSKLHLAFIHIEAATRCFTPGTASPITSLLTKKALICAALLPALLACLIPPALAADLTWENAISLALQNNPNVVAAQRSEESAAKALQKARAGALPQVTFNSKPYASGLDTSNSNKKEYYGGSASVSASMATPKGIGGKATLAHEWDYEGTPLSSLSFSAGADLDPEGLFYNTLQLSLLAARNNLEKANLDLAAQRRSIAINTLAVFLRLELDNKRLAIAKEKADAANKNYAVARKRRELGAISDAEMIAAEIEKLQTEISLRNQQADYHAKQAAFAADLGVAELPPLAPTGGVSTTELVKEYSNSQLSTAAKENSIAALKRKIDLQLDTVELRQAELSLYPDVSLDASLKFTDLSAMDVRLKRPWSITLSVDLPLVDGGRRRITVQERKSDLGHTTAALARDLETSELTIRNKLADWQNACRGVQLAQLKLQKANLDEQAKARLQKAGLANDDGVSNARWTTQLAEIDLQTAINEQRLIELDINGLTGGQLTFKQLTLVK